VVPTVPTCYEFGFHINVEVTLGMRSIKYIHNTYTRAYRTLWEFGKDKDEIKQYLSAC